MEERVWVRDWGSALKAVLWCTQMRSMATNAHQVDFFVVVRQPIEVVLYNYTVAGSNITRSSAYMQVYILLWLIG